MAIEEGVGFNAHDDLVHLMYHGKVRPSRLRAWHLQCWRWRGAGRDVAKTIAVARITITSEWKEGIDDVAWLSTAHGHGGTMAAK